MQNRYKTREQLMNNSISEISLFNLSLSFLPVLIVLIIFIKWSMDIKKPLYAISRMLLQLLVIGYLLTYIFSAQTSWVVLVVLSFMLVVASWIALNSVPQSVDHSKHALFRAALIAIFLGGGGTLLVITQGVLALDPWYLPHYMIPLAGMVFSSAMTSISLVAERYYAELEHGHEVENARNTAYRASMIPTINALFAVGLVSLPGMMTGQIISGVDPLVAARYQIMVMLMILGSSGIASALFLALITRRPPS